MPDISSNLGLNLPKGSDTFDYDVFLRQNFQKIDDQLKANITETFTASAGQTVVTLVHSYIPGAGALSVEVDGVPQYVGSGYTETDSNTITFTEGLNSGAPIKVTILGLVPANDERFNGIESSLAEIAILPSIANNNDITTILQTVVNNLQDGQTLKIPFGNFTISNYITFSNKNKIKIIMDGVIAPNANLSNVNSGLFLFQNCNDVRIIPTFINPDYQYTCNVIKLINCHNFRIYRGNVDIKYNSFDGTGFVNIGDNCTGIKIFDNYACSGFGVICNDAIGIDNVSIHHNEFEGQKKYGSLGTGDSVEFNMPINGAKNISIYRNKAHGYQAHNPGGFDARVINFGLANVTDFILSNNEVWDSEMEAFHVENGTSKGLIHNNKVNGCIIGIHLNPNSSKDLTDISILNNEVFPGVQPSAYSGVDYGAAILVNVNSGSAGISKRITLSNNTCVGVTGSARGICVYDIDTITVSDNIVNGFPRAGMDIRKFGALGTGVSNATITDNKVNNCGWNYVIGGLSGAGNLTNVIFDRNTGIGSLFNLNFNSEIATKTNCIIRIPYDTTGLKLSVGDVLYTKNPTAFSINEYIVTVSGGTGTWKAIPYQQGDKQDVILFSKNGTTNTITFTVTYASNASFAVPKIITIEATGVAANGTGFEYIQSKYIVRHTTAINNASKVGSDVVVGTPTVTESNSGLTETFTVTFTSATKTVAKITIEQPNVADQTQGGIISVA